MPWLELAHTVVVRMHVVYTCMLGVVHVHVLACYTRVRLHMNELVDGRFWYT
jgi:hypothetical protein